MFAVMKDFYWKCIEHWAEQDQNHESFPQNIYIHLTNCRALRKSRALLPLHIFHFVLLQRAYNFLKCAKNYLATLQLTLSMNVKGEPKKVWQGQENSACMLQYGHQTFQN